MGGRVCLQGDLPPVVLYPVWSASRIPGGGGGEGASASGGYMGYYGIRSTSGWYTFYWNALLFTVMFYVVDSSSSDSPYTAEPTSSTVIGTM